MDLMVTWAAGRGRVRAGAGVGGSMTVAHYVGGSCWWGREEAEVENPSGLRWEAGLLHLLPSLRRVTDRSDPRGVGAPDHLGRMDRTAWAPPHDLGGSLGVMTLA